MGEYVTENLEMMQYGIFVRSAVLYDRKVSVSLHGNIIYRMVGPELVHGAEISDRMKFKE